MMATASVQSVDTSPPKEGLYSWGLAKEGIQGPRPPLNKDRIEGDLPFPVHFKHAPEEKFTAVDGGALHSVGLDENGLVWSWGCGLSGRLGSGMWEGRSRPAVIKALRAKTTAKIACGAEHTFAVLDNGKIYGWGWNRHGQVGVGDVTDRPSPALVDLSEGVEDVACGLWHTVACSVRGTLYSWGSNDLGQLGLPDGKGVVKQPTIVEGLDDVRIVQVACGEKHTAVLSDDGKVYVFGDNTMGQLGQGSLRKEMDAQPTLVGGLPKVIQVACGAQTTYALTETGSVFSWGAGYLGQLGLGDTNDRAAPSLVHDLKGKRVTKIAAGHEHVLAMTGGGELLVWGNSQHGQLGLEDHGKQLVPAVLNVAEGCKVDAIGCGYGHSLAIVTPRSSGATPVAPPQMPARPAQGNGFGGAFRSSRFVKK